MPDDLASLIDAFMVKGQFSHITMSMGSKGPVVALRGARDGDYSRDTLVGQKASEHLRTAILLALPASRKPKATTKPSPKKATSAFDDILG